MFSTDTCCLTSCHVAQQGRPKADQLDRSEISSCSGRRASLLGVPNLRRTSTRDPPQLRRGSVAEGWLRPSQGAEPPSVPSGGFVRLLLSAHSAARCE